MLDLKPEYLSIVRSLIKKFVPGMTVWAYGSRVTGKAYEGSDLDLAIINPTNAETPQKNLAALRSAFSESDLPISVDVFDWAVIPDSFREEIKKHHVELSNN